MDWKKFVRLILAPIRWLLGDKQDEGALAVPEYWNVIRGSNPSPFTDKATVRFLRLEGAYWEVSLRPVGEGEFTELGILTRQGDTWSGHVTIHGNREFLALSLSPQPSNRTERFLFGIVLDDSPIPQQDQGTWGAEEED